MSLWGLWEVSIALSAASLLIMFGLIVARLVAEARKRKIEARRGLLVSKMLSGQADLADIAPRGKCDDQTTELMVELISMVRGKERENFVALATRVGARDRLLQTIRTGTVRGKVGAAEGLSHFADALATDALDKALEDKSADVRLAAALSLAKSGRAPPVRVLVNRLSLSQAENSLLLISILQSVAHQHPVEVETLLEDEDVQPVVKAAAIEALSALGSFHTAPTINRLALDTTEESDVLARYLRALGVLRHPAGIPAVVRYLDGRTWWVRAAAAEAAGKIGVTSALPKLAELLDDEDWWVRFRAGEALANLGEKGVEILREATQRPGPFRQEAARLTLAEAGIPDVA